MSEPASIPVALRRCESYAPAPLKEAVANALEGAGVLPKYETRVLVKPNLVSASKGPLACTEPAILRAVCEVLADAGCTIRVADSPAFGSAAGVAAKAGLEQAIAPLGLKVESLTDPSPLPLRLGGYIGLSRRATDTDVILNLPRLKAHCQMLVTAAVKNLFGCVCGMRKAVAHYRFGERANQFESMILDVTAALPPVTTLLDAVTAMHVTGPTGGEPIHPGFISASPCPIASDTATYAMLGLAPDDLPLWREARKRKLTGAFARHLVFPLKTPEAFDLSNFRLPDQIPVAFHPTRLASGAIKRLYIRLKETTSRDA